MTKKPKVLIPVGYGLNCEEETDYAFRSQGADVERIFIKDLESKPKRILDYDIIAIIGGFSYADHIAAGTILKNKLKYSMGAELQEFVSSGKLIIGIIFCHLFK